MNLLRTIALAAGLAASAVPAAAASDTVPVTLKPNVMVNGPVVRLGDLFDGLTEKAGMPIARAPEVGAQIQLDARWLASVAHRFRLPWRPSSLLERTVVERASQTIGPQRIEAEILNGIRARGMDGDLSIQLDNPAFAIRLPREVESSLRIGGLSYDRTSGRFVAHIVAPDSERPLTRSTISGRVHQMTEIPILARQVEPGAVIRPDDIDWNRVRADKLGRGVALDSDKLVGMSPRRPLRLGEPIRLRDLRQPLVIEKNNLVTIVFETDRMILTAQGRALEDGASGQAIRVMNTASNSVITATVRSAGTVAVNNLASAALN